ncbi:unnamed protein product [Laminaria digitata]
MCQPKIPALYNRRYDTPHPAALVNPICAKRFHRHYRRQPALLDRHYRGTTTAVLNRHYSTGTTQPALLDRHYSYMHNTELCTPYTIINVRKYYRYFTPPQYYGPERFCRTQVRTTKSLSCGAPTYIAIGVQYSFHGTRLAHRGTPTSTQQYHIPCPPSGAFSHTLLIYT